MIDYLRQLAQTTINTFLHNPNQFASGGMLLMVIGAIGASLRSIPTRLWAWIVHQTTISIAITDDQKAYWWTKIWLETRSSTKRTRHLDVMNRGSENYAMIPAPGKHWIWYNWRPISIRISRTEEKAMKDNWLGKRSESLIMTTIGRKQNLFRSLMSDIRSEFIKEDEKKPELHAWNSYGEWSQVHGYVPRFLDSVILPDRDKQRLVKDIEQFRANRKWYGDMGIPYRKGYLFHGPPGTGKTSLVTGLSSYFKSDVYIVKLSDMSDATLREAISRVAENSFLVMEDIDTVDASKDRDQKQDSESKGKGVTLSGLLNVIDGMLSPNGAIFVLTTNHKDKLDPALIRPGRVDMQLEITYATSDQKQKLYNRFSPGQKCPDTYLEKQMTMAELQQELMERRLESI